MATINHDEERNQVKKAKKKVQISEVRKEENASDATGIIPGLSEAQAM